MYLIFMTVTSAICYDATIMFILIIDTTGSLLFRVKQKMYEICFPVFVLSSLAMMAFVVCVYW